VIFELWRRWHELHMPGASHLFINPFGVSWLWISYLTTLVVYGILKLILVGDVVQYNYMKTWYRYIIFYFLFFILFSNTFTYAASSQINPLNYAKPVNNLINNTIKDQGINTSLPSLKNQIQKVKDSGGVTSLSSSDFISGARSVATLAINLFLTVIQTVAGILKGLLPFLSK